MHARSETQAFVTTAESRPQVAAAECLRSRWMVPAIFTKRLAVLAATLLRTWARRYRKRQELLDLLATDHRIAADVGSTEDELKGWACKPFWRA